MRSRDKMSLLRRHSFEGVYFDGETYVMDSGNYKLIAFVKKYGRDDLITLMRPYYIGEQEYRVTIKIDATMIKSFRGDGTEVFNSIKVMMDRNYEQAKRYYEQTNSLRDPI